MTIITAKFKNSNLCFEVDILFNIYNNLLSQCITSIYGVYFECSMIAKIFDVKYQ